MSYSVSLVKSTCLDDKFVDYITKAAEAELNIGVYFYSQAITEEEAVEEANFVIENLANYQITCRALLPCEIVPCHICHKA